jgi:hypothetical protein
MYKVESASEWGSESVLEPVCRLEEALSSPQSTELPGHPRRRLPAPEGWESRWAWELVLVPQSARASELGLASALLEA